MATEEQINANRENAKKSTGPRTPEGKARSSRNGSIHGLTGKSPLLPGEDPAELREIAQGYYDDYRPVTNREFDIIERMAVIEFRLRRIARIEAGSFDMLLRFKSVPEEYNADGQLDPLAWCFHLDHNYNRIFERLSLYEARLQRQASQCLHDLLSLRAARLKEHALLAKIGKGKAKPNPAASPTNETAPDPSEPPTNPTAPPDSAPDAR